MKKVSRRRRPLLLAAATAAIALVLAGCSLTGGGQLPGQYAPTASFGFSAVNTVVSKGNSSVGQYNVAGNYQDGYLKLRFTGGYHQTSQPCDTFYFSWTSTNPFLRGGGTGYATICDYGEPNLGNDTFEIHLSGAPYDGYSNSGPVTNGNLKINNQAP